MKKGLIYIVKFALKEGKPFRRYHIVILMLAIVSGVFQVLVALLIKDFGNALISNQDITMQFIVILLVCVIIALTNFGSNYILDALKKKGQLLFCKYIYRKLLETPISEFRKISPGEYLSRILSDTVFVGMIIAAAIPSLIINFGSTIVYFIVLFVLNFYVGLFTVLFVPILILFYLYQGKKLIKAMSEERKSYADFTESLRIKVESLPMIRNFAVEDKMVELLEKDGNTWYKKIKRVIFVDRGFGQTYRLLIAVLPILILYVLNLISLIEAGLAIAFLYFLPQALEPLTVLSTDIGGLYQAIPAIERVEEILQLKKAPSGKRDLKRVDRITLSAVSYSYDNNFVLKDVTLDLKRGDRIGIVGKSGSGKSTLVGIITGLYEPTSGKCEINNIPINEYDARKLRKKIILCTNNDPILPGTVADNISLFEDGYSRENIEKVWKDVCLDKELALEEKIGPGIREISDGQRQRITIARALLRKPDVLILDEALAGIEPTLEGRIIATLKREIPCLIVISHRLSTLMQMDEICVLSDGMIVARDKPEKICENEEFKKLMKLEIVK